MWRFHVNNNTGQQKDVEVELIQAKTRKINAEIAALENQKYPAKRSPGELTIEAIKVIGAFVVGVGELLPDLVAIKWLKSKRKNTNWKPEKNRKKSALKTTNYQLSMQNWKKRGVHTKYCKFS